MSLHAPWSDRARTLGAPLVAALLLASAGAAPARALPALCYRWNDCAEPAVDLPFGGPGVYRQVIAAGGFDRPTGGSTFSILITGFAGCARAAFPDAWRFDSGGCQSGRIAWSTAGLGASCPALVGPSATYRYEYVFYDDELGQDVRMRFAVEHGAALPDPAQSYALWVIDYDLGDAAVGAPGSPGSCGDADRSLCFYLIAGEWRTSSGGYLPFLFGNRHLTWQDQRATGFCPAGCTAARPSTWSRIRARYR